MFLLKICPAQICFFFFFLFVVVLFFVLFFVFFALTASHQDQKLAVNCDPLVIQICPAGVFVC